MAKTTGETSSKPMKPVAPRKARAATSATNGSNTTGQAKAKFAKALEEAREGALLFGKEAQERAGAYREKASAAGGEWMDEAKAKGGQARDRAWDLANEGKTRASEAISSIGKMVDDSAATIDEKVGPKYGDYARTAAKSMQDAADRIEAKDLGELGEDAKEFVRKSPGVAVGIAAVAGFMLARLFRRNDA